MAKRYCGHGRNRQTWCGCLPPRLRSTPILIMSPVRGPRQLTLWEAPTTPVISASGLRGQGSQAWVGLGGSNAKVRRMCRPATCKTDRRRHRRRHQPVFDTQCEWQERCRCRDRSAIRSDEGSPVSQTLARLWQRSDQGGMRRSGATGRSELDAVRSPDCTPPRPLKAHEPRRWSERPADSTGRRSEQPPPPTRVDMTTGGHRPATV